MNHQKRIWLQESSTKDRIILQGASLFAAYGYDAVTIRQIAQKVQIKAASIYNHFPGKEDILHAILDYYETSIAFYYPTLSEFYDLIERESVTEVLGRLTVSFCNEEYEIMMNATTIIIREQFNNDYACHCFQHHFIDKAQTLIKGVLDRLVFRGKIKPHDTEAIAMLWVYSYNSIAMDAARNISGRIKDKIIPVEVFMGVLTQALRSISTEDIHQQ